MGRPRAEEVTTSTRDRLLEAAEQEFADVGFEAAKLADIAARAGIRRPSLLYHFKTKEDLYGATVERAFTQLGVALQATMSAAGDFEARLLATVAGYARFVADHPNVARDRKSTRLNSSHLVISYAVFCLKKKKLDT